MKVIEASVDELYPDPDQPRREFPEPELLELGASLAVYQLVALIVFASAPGFLILDGERRWRAAKLVGKKTLRVEVLTEMPTRSELTVMQLVANCQRQDLTILEQLNAYEQLMQTLKCSASDLAKRLFVSKAKVSGILALRNLTAEERELVRNGTLSGAKAYAVARMDELGRAEAMRQIQNGTFTREKAERLSSAKGKETKPSQKHIQLQAVGATLRITSDTALNVDAALDVLDDVTRELKKARSQNLDISTAALVLRDRTKNRQSAEAAS